VGHDDVVAGEDGVPRCAWSDGTADYREYHDVEWGYPVHGDVALFERITLEAFQSGLSWLTILRKRPGFRAAFHGFEPGRVARYDGDDVVRLMGDASIVRNRRKIDATIANAQALVRLQAESGSTALDSLVWSFASGPRPRPRVLSEIPASTAASIALSKALKARGFVFVGPTTMYAGMQACGLVDDHVVGCHRAGG
jgi:DNA-3-methyladenine glycosylase I